MNNHSISALNYLLLIVLLTILAGYSFSDQTIEGGTVVNVFLFGAFVSVAGVFLIGLMCNAINSNDFNVFSTIWFTKLIASLVVFIVGWVPELYSFTADFGMDAQRFYFQSKELADSNFNSNDFNLNYIGVLYYYGIFFKILGASPLIPLFINSLLVLIALITVIRICVAICPNHRKRIWIVGLVLLLPEIVWYDVMTSRETTMMALLTISMLLICFKIGRSKRNNFNPSTIAIIVCLLSIVAIRASMLIPVVVCALLFVALFKSKNSNIIPKMLMIFVLFGFLFIGPSITQKMGGYQFDYSDLVAMKVGGGAVDDNREWSQNSIGKRLVPSNPLQAVIYAFPRSVLYLIAPIPNVRINIFELAGGAWYSWHLLLSAISSLVYIGMLPYVLASVWSYAVNSARSSAHLILIIPFLTLFFAVCGGNYIIHGRYRVMFALLFFACAWLGANASNHIIKKCMLMVYGSIFLVIGSLFYLNI